VQKGHGIDLAWYGETDVAQSEHRLTEGGTEVAVLRPSGEVAGRVTTTPQDGCDPTFANSPFVIAKDQLGGLWVCQSAEGLHQDDHAWLGSVDSETWELTPFAEIEGHSIEAADVAWDAPRDRGLVAIGGAICSGVVWVTRTGEMSAPDWTFSGDGKTFVANDPSATDPNGDCGSTGRVASPAIRPGSDDLAILVSPGSVGVSGRARADVPWSIALVDLPTGDVRSLIEGVNGATGLSWSPDGRSLAIAGQPHGRADGAWIADVESGELRQIASGLVQSVAWSPGGSEVALVRYADGPDPLATELVIVGAGR
jgi:dipeptidyl aminopeptidase/acylaminoacyl peptidase